MPSVRLSTGLFIVAVAACTEAAPSTSSSSSELTAEQCMYFQDGGRTTVCHATGSARNPIVQITVATAACRNAHAGHAGDFVAVDGSCGPDACLAEDSPCDATLPCCDGLTCGADARCEPPPVTCVGETFEQFGCNFALANGSAVFGGLATIARTIGTNPLATYVPGDENCELSFGSCTTLSGLDTPFPIVATTDAGSQITIAFGQVIESFSLGALYSSSSTTFVFKRGGAVVLTATIDRTGADCLDGAAGSWTVPGGFDTLVANGNQFFGFTDLQACYRP